MGRFRIYLGCISMVDFVCFKCYIKWNLEQSRSAGLKIFYLSFNLSCATKIIFFSCNLSIWKLRKAALAIFHDITFLYNLEGRSNRKTKKFKGIHCVKSVFSQCFSDPCFLTLKAFFVLKIFKFLSWLFGHV